MPTATAEARVTGDGLERALLALAALGLAALSTAGALLVRALPGFRWQGVGGAVVAAIVVALFVIGGMYVLVHQHRGVLQARLREMRDAARALAGGDLEVALPEADDEVGTVGRAVNVLAARTARLLHAQRDLLAGVSHELRSPLARINIALELIEMGRGDADGELRELVEGIREEVDLLERHISRLLEAQRVSSQRVLLTRKPVDVAALVGAVMAREQRRLLRLGWDVELAIDTGDCQLLLDENAIDRVVSTLVENAIQHAATPTADGSPAPEAHRPSLRVEAQREAGEVVIRVMDRGAGLSEEQCARAFEPFARIDRSRSTQTGGTGLGLYLARTICEAHGGSAGTRPREGGGLCVELRLRERDSREQRETMRVASLADIGISARPAVGAASGEEEST